MRYHISIIDKEGNNIAGGMITADNDDEMKKYVENHILRDNESFSVDEVAE